MDYQTVPEGKDPHLWQLAQRRASFKRHLATYIVINLFLWVLWYFTRGMYDYSDRYSVLPWPVWPMIGWGIGLTFHYINAYVSTGHDTVEREYDKLKNQHK
ncbi:MAG: 2TM domain-containing protein [Flavisolibacter sp.]